VNNYDIGIFLRDNGGRRSGIERRYFSYTSFIPEKRSNNDRRSSLDRRSGRDRRDDKNDVVISLVERRDFSDRRKFWNEMLAVQ
jgi:hypothetical protein